MSLIITQLQDPVIKIHRYKDLNLVERKVLLKMYMLDTNIYIYIYISLQFFFLRKKNYDVWKVLVIDLIQDE